MNATVTLDKAGRIVLPKSVREALRVGPGDSREIETEDDRMVVSPVRPQPSLQKEQGGWVYRSGTRTDASIRDLIDEQRALRTREVIGREP